jgi:hypothetical protein|tara:strand:+ start:2633 stop:2860 length:228 start_codon:yes stop_codon:yes gene_type:complete
MIGKIYITSDIAIAAFLMMKGMQLISAARERNGRFKFEFDDTKDEAGKYAVGFANSESAKFDAHIKNLKNLIFKN